MINNEGTDAIVSSGEEDEHAHHHIAAVLRLATTNVADSVDIQVVTDGSQLTLDRIANNALSIRAPILVTDTPESIGMQLPRGMPNSSDDDDGDDERTNPTVREIGAIVGMNTEVRVIDVKLQKELHGWIFRDLVEYFEDEKRLLLNADNSKRHCRSRRPRRHTSKSRYCNERPDVLNQVSLEFSNTKLAQHVKSPALVRQLDWVTACWPKSQAKGRPQTQYYCLTSARGCYMDFHIDFGGTSVWYHVLQGAKVFVLIRPTAANLQRYEEWLCSPQQYQTFLPDTLDNARDDVFKIHLQPSQTMLIPSGWIHAVYTPEDSLVFGGNFLHSYDIGMQLNVYRIETRTQVKIDYRFPRFIELHFFAGAMYVKQVKKCALDPNIAPDLVQLGEALDKWRTAPDTTSSLKNSALLASKSAGCASVEDLIQILQHGVIHDTASMNVDLASSDEVALANADTAIATNSGTDEDIKEAKPPTKLVVRLSPAKAQSMQSPRSTDGDPVIRISAAALQESTPRPSDLAVGAARRLPREDTDECIPSKKNIMELDEEWLPTTTTAKRKRLHDNREPTRRQMSGSKPMPSRADPLTNSRQRLMRKMR